MTGRAVVKIIKSPYGPGIGAGPVLTSPSTEAERTAVAEQAAKVAKLLAKASPAQLALFSHLAESSPEKGYVVTAASWIETILKATKGLSEAEITKLYGFNWTERDISPEELHRELLAALQAP